MEITRTTEAGRQHCDAHTTCVRREISESARWKTGTVTGPYQSGPSYSPRQFNPWDEAEMIETINALRAAAGKSGTC